MGKCAQHCNGLENCFSFNFCKDDENHCQLNSADVFSTEKGGFILRNSSSCNYFGMKREAVQVCRNEDQPCMVNSKTVDHKWGPWSSVNIYRGGDPPIYESLMRRDVLVQNAHGGDTGKNDTSDFSQNWYNLFNKRTNQDLRCRNVVKI